MVKIIVFNLLLIAGTILSVFLTPVDPFEKEGGIIFGYYRPDNCNHCDNSDSTDAPVVCIRNS